MTYSYNQALATMDLDDLNTVTLTDVGGGTPLDSCSNIMSSVVQAGNASRRRTGNVGDNTDKMGKKGDGGHSWEAVAQNVESAISAMERVAQYVGQNSRNKLSHSLRRCYLRARSIREIRGVLQIEDRSDHDHFLANKCMLGNFLRGEI